MTDTVYFAGCTADLASGKKTDVFGGNTLMMIAIIQESEEHMMDDRLAASGYVMSDILKIVRDEVRHEDHNMLAYALFGLDSTMKIPSWREIHPLNINASRRLTERIYAGMEGAYDVPEYDEMVRKVMIEIRRFICDRIMKCRTFVEYYAMMREAAKHTVILYDKKHGKKHSRMEKRAITEIVLDRPARLRRGRSFWKHMRRFAHLYEGRV